MIRHALIALVFLALSTGPAGPPGPGEITVYEGTIPSSGDVTVSVPELSIDALSLNGDRYRIIVVAPPEG
jgi:hypothetical protein